MCGRFTLTTKSETIEEYFDVENLPELEPRSNIAPTQMIPCVLRRPEGRGPTFQLLRWGLIPSWASDAKIGARMINARSETVAIKPSFRSAFRSRRCLVVADGFYEWLKLPRRKQPYWFRMADGSPFGFAGLWEHWTSADGEMIDSCTLLTTTPNELVRPIHDRMPVILHRGDFATWLDPELKSTDRLTPLLAPFPADLMQSTDKGP